jgi:BirA family transcriptional regulator, biotin operon repressor / biotin---[acetyl-CoA-carboxylase] ligase
VTLLLTDPAPAEHWPELSFVAALAIHDAVAEIAPAVKPQLAIKWPNDLLLAGAKFAGILIEGEGNDEIGAVAVGIGINCANHPAGTDYLAADLSAAGANVTPAVLFAALSAKMLGRLAQWNQGEHFSTIRADWLSRAAGLGETIRVRMTDRELAGRFDGIDDSGHLVLELPEGGTQTITAGDVIALEPSGSPPPPAPRRRKR